MPTPDAALKPGDLALIGADIVGYNPRRDDQEMTAAVAAKLVKEIGGQMPSQS